MLGGGIDEMRCDYVRPLAVPSGLLRSGEAVSGVGDKVAV